MYDDFMTIYKEAGLIKGLSLNFPVDFLFQAILHAYCYLIGGYISVAISFCVKPMMHKFWSCRDLNARINQ